MRRGLVVVLGLLAAAAGLTATPAPVQARDLPGALLGVITRPLGAIFGGPRTGRRSSKARKASRPPAPVATQTQPAIAAPAATAAGAAAVGTAVAVTAGATSAEAKPTDIKPADTKAAETAIDKAVTVPAGPAQTATPVATTTAPVATSPLPAVVAPTTAAASTPAARPAATAAISEPKVEPKPEAKPETRPAAPATTAATPAPAPARSAAVAQPGEAAAPRSAEQPPARQQPTAAPAPPPRTWLRLGVTGPLTWPTALEDVVGFTLWPGEYSERLRAHGIGDVMNTVMVPASALAARLRPTQTTARADTRQPPAGSLGVCNLAPASDDWPAAPIERTMEFNAEQRAALTQLTTAFGEAAVRIRATCRDEASPSSADRLRTMQAMLWTVHDSAIQLRAPLAKFYGSLTDEQRQKFAAPASAQADPRSMTPAAIARLCGVPQSNDGMIRQAEQSLNLNRAQRASLDAFQKKSAEMGQFLMASCLRPVAATPVERIDAAADRLTALIFAASTVNLALNDFYNQLDDGQRSKFDSAVR
jgi:hypothetical protein